MNFRKRSFIFPLVIVSILPFINGCKSEDDPVTPPAEHFEPEGLYITNATFDTVVYYFQGTIRAEDTLKVPAGNNLSPHWNIHFLDNNRQIIAPPVDASHSLGWTIANPAITEVFRDPGDEWDFHLRGLQQGITTIVLKVIHGDHADFQTVPIPVLVDSSVHGEAAGLEIYDEESGVFLAGVSIGGVISGSLSVVANSTTDHAVVYFLDDEGSQFQPAVPPHSLNFSIADTGIAVFVTPTVDEPWAFQLTGRTAGATTATFMLIVDGEAEYISPSIPINVTP